MTPAIAPVKEETPSEVTTRLHNLLDDASRALRKGVDKLDKTLGK